jgi:hypothetical protein
MQYCKVIQAYRNLYGTQCKTLVGMCNAVQGGNFEKNFASRAKCGSILVLEDSAVLASFFRKKEEMILKKKILNASVMPIWFFFVKERPNRN